MNKLETLYQKELTIRAAYDKAEAAGDDAGIEKTRQDMRDLETKAFEKGTIFNMLFTEYTESRDAGNTTIDFHNVVWDSEIADIVKVLKECGVETFTYSCTATEAIKTGWLFQENGYTCEGIGQVYETFKSCFSNEYEKSAALFFRVK